MSSDSDEIVFKNGGSVGTLAHKPFLKKAEKFSPLSMAHTWLNRVMNIPFNMAILLESSWGSIFEFHPHPFMFVYLFKINIFLALSLCRDIIINFKILK